MELGISSLLVLVILFRGGELLEVDHVCEVELEFFSWVGEAVEVGEGVDDFVSVAARN